MIPFTKVEQVVTNERKAVLPFPATVPPIVSPFPVALTEGRTTELAQVVIDLRHDRDVVLLLAAVNWSATFPSTAFTVGGFVDVTFELLRDGAVIYRVIQSTVQGENTSGTSPTLTVFNITGLSHLDTAPLTGKAGVVTYSLRATNINIVEPMGGTSVTVTAEVGAVTLTTQEIKACVFR